MNYGQALKPDFAITCKYSADDYGDFRRWNKSLGVWEWYDPTTNTYTTAQGYNIENDWTHKGADSFSMSIPWAAFGTPPDSMRLELYITQDAGGAKRAAFDSAPQDSTLNLTFDYLNPAPHDWDAALNWVTLVAWSTPYHVKTTFAAAPAVSEVQVAPTQINAGELITLTALVMDGGGGIGDVLADLSAAGGGALSRMFDDGDPVHGDLTAGDHLYSLRTLIPVSNPGGNQILTVTAFDGSNAVSASGTASLKVIAVVEPLLQVTDPVGDDHGPNQPGTARKYYTYPTNIVFGPGSFDLTGLTIYETTATVGGQSIDMIAFQVSMVDFPDPADPSTADWNPTYAEINIQKIDILIDSGPGGSTATIPNRQAGCQPWDAWDYAVIIDGWYKGVIPSLGQNTVQSWRDNALSKDQDIILVSDPQLNTITALVSRADLGDPTVEDIKSWDIAVCMLGHDGNTDFGGVRWVNEARSEWNFGGGQNSDRDSNIMDLMLIPGSGHLPGKTQEEILDYESPEALDRLKQGLTPVAIEMSAFEDTGPPVIDTGGGGSVVTRVEPLTGAPIAMTMNISDDNRVAHAELRYRSSSFSGQGWQREVPMGSLGSNLWVVDILPSWLDSNLVYSPVDSTRYLEFEVSASDASNPAKVSVSPVTTLQVTPSADSRLVSTPMSDGDLTLLQIDGSTLMIPDGLRRDFLARHIAEAWTGADVSADTMGGKVSLSWGIHNVPETLKDSPQVPPGQPLGVFREITLVTRDTLGGLLDQGGHLPIEAQLSLHYPQAWVPRGADESQIGIYEYNWASNRWILAGGTVSVTGNRVTATIDPHRNLRPVPYRWLAKE